MNTERQTKVANKPVLGLFVRVKRVTNLSVLSFVFLLGFGSMAVADQWIKVEQTKAEKMFYLEALVEAVNQSQLTAETSGKVQKVLVDVNDYVEAGQVIIELNNTQQKAQLKQAEARLQQASANLSVATTQLTRGKTLFDQGSLSQGDLDQLIAREKSAVAARIASQASVNQASENLNYTRIKAPYSGIVSKRLIEPGESVFPGKPLITGLSLTKLRAEASLPQRFANVINRKQEFKIQLGEQSIQPTKVTLFPFADKSSHSIQVRVEFDSHEGTETILPGMWVKLAIPVDQGEQKQILIPSSSVIKNGAISTVIVKQKGKSVIRHVKLGQRKGTDVEVLSGLSVGDEIHISGTQWLIDQKMSKSEVK